MPQIRCVVSGITLIGPSEISDRFSSMFLANLPTRRLMGFDSERANVASFYRLTVLNPEAMLALIVSACSWAEEIAIISWRARQRCSCVWRERGSGGRHSPAEAVWGKFAALTAGGDRIQTAGLRSDRRRSFVAPLRGMVVAHLSSQIVARSWLT